MLFARRAQRTRQRLGQIFDIDGAISELAFLPDDLLPLFRRSCDLLNRNQRDGASLLQIVQDLEPFMRYTVQSVSGVDKQMIEQPSPEPGITKDAQEQGQHDPQLPAKMDLSEEERRTVQQKALEEAQLYLLCLIAVAHNQLVCDKLIPIASDIQANRTQWQQKEDQPFWYIYEKTPYFWFKYWIRNRGSIPHPNQELKTNLMHLRTLEKNIFAFLGVGSRIMARYAAVGKTNHAQKFANLVFKDQVLFKRFYSIPDRDNALQTDEVKLEAVKKHDPLRYLSYLRLSSIIPGTHGLLRHQEEEEEGLIEEEQPEKEEVLFNLAQNITASHFDFASCEIEGEITKREAEDTISIEGLYGMALDNIHKATTFHCDIYNALNRYRRPHPLVANWLTYTIATMTVTGALISFAKCKEDLVDWTVNAHVVAINFLRNNILEPIREMYKVIRYDERTFTIMNETAMETDAESLSRMVIDYIESNGIQLPPERLNQLSVQAALGDISPIMPIYEQQLSKPIKNMLFGDLLSLMLIQVQKAKVDVERAMIALDKLMRANELNFQLFAVTPSVLVTGALASFLYRRVTKIDVRRTTYISIREVLRNVERLLDLNLSQHPHQTAPGGAYPGNHSSARPLSTSLHLSTSGVVTTASSPQQGGGLLRLEEAGRLLICINDLTIMANGLSRRDRQWFLEDLSDLQAEELHVGQKLATIHRMYHTHSFLSVQ